MTRNQVIESLYLSKNFNECLGKMEPEHLRDDLRSEVILIICELSDDKLIGMAQRKELEFYTVRVILNLIKSDTSPFHKMYRQTHVNIEHRYGFSNYFEQNCELPKPVVESIYKYQLSSQTPFDEEQRLIKERLEDLAMSEIDNLYWYDKEMILMYKRLGNFRAIEAETGIPFISCYKNIKKSLQTLKQAAISKHKATPVFSKDELKTIQP